jgi:secreted trypsin-like serine protease
VGTATAAVTSGDFDPGDPAVVRIEGGLSPCTGTLIAPRVVLSAAHCLDRPLTTVYVGADDKVAGDRIGVSAQATHPEYDAISVENDIALVLLERPSAVEPVAWNDGGPTKSWVGANVRLVGFGLTSPGQPRDGRKRMGTARISAASDTELEFTAAPSLPCLGDSGGPILAGDQVIGVISTGDPDCVNHARAMRVDAYAHSFIAPRLATWEAASATGAGCTAGVGRPIDPWDALLALAGWIVAVRLTSASTVGPSKGTPEERVASTTDKRIDVIG